MKVHARELDDHSCAQALLLGLLVLLALSTAAARAGAEDRTDGETFLRTEYRVLGGSAAGTWQRGTLTGPRAFQQIAGDEIGGGGAVPVPEEKVAGPSNTGDKVKAGLFSAILPGAGQYYNGQRQKAYIMGGIEVAIWTAYFVFDAQGDSRRESSREWASIYAGTSGEHADNYWQNVGKYTDSDAFNESRLREARALGEPVSGLVGGSDAWQWVNTERQNGYAQLRADGNAAYDRRDFMILFAVVNRAVAVVDAVLGAGKDQGLLGTEVMGMNLDVEMLPSFRDPGARCVISRSF